MTLHAAKGLEFDTVFLPGWEEGLFPNQRALDDQGRAGLEEERRLGHVGITRARKRAKIYFATNRRMHGTWSSNIPSRFLDELPEAHVEVTESKGGFGMSGYGPSRFDDDGELRLELRHAGLAARAGAQCAPVQRDARSNEDTTQRLSANTARQSFTRPPLTIEGELVARSTGEVSDFARGDRVFHQKFGNGNVTAVDGNKLTIAFDKAGEKRVVDSSSSGWASKQRGRMAVSRCYNGVYAITREPCHENIAAVRCRSARGECGLPGRGHPPRRRRVPAVDRSGNALTRSRPPAPATRAAGNA